MKRLIIALAAVPLSVALAQTSPSAPPPTQSMRPPPVTVTPDLDARLHHQPTEAEVTVREKQREGSAEVDQRNQKEKQETDDLYQQLLGKPATK